MKDGAYEGWLGTKAKDLIIPFATDLDLDQPTLDLADLPLEFLLLARSFGLG